MCSFTELGDNPGPYNCTHSHMAYTRTGMHTPHLLIACVRHAAKHIVYDTLVMEGHLKSVFWMCMSLVLVIHELFWCLVPGNHYFLPCDKKKPCESDISPTE